MKLGNVKLDDIETVVTKLQLSFDKADKLKKCLKENLKHFLPCDIPQEKIIAFSLQEKYRDIIDFMYSEKSSFDDMDSAILYLKHSHNIDYVMRRISNIFEKIDFVDKSKEIYFQENFCNEEMLGKSADFFYKWYSAVLEFFDYQKSGKSIQSTFDLFQQLINDGIEFAGKYICELFKENIVVSFLEYKESKNQKRVINLIKNSLFESLLDYREYEKIIYQYMVKTDFSTVDLNPEKMIFDLWDDGKDTQQIAERLGLESNFITNFLIEQNKIEKKWIIDSWNEGNNSRFIAREFRLEKEDVKIILKENWLQLKRDYYDDEPDYYDDFC